MVKKLEGVQTVESVMALLGVTKQKAIYYLHRMRKKGYLKAKRTSLKKRVYNISFENKLEGGSYYDIINQHSPMKLAARDTYKVYGKRLTPEDAIVFAVKTKSLRTILASLPLFNHVKDWPSLYRSARKEGVEREIGALYDVARKNIKVRRMNRHYRANAAPKIKSEFHFIIEGMKSKDYKGIENEWKVYIPFNKIDLEEIK
ncbi:MAG: hypothetical protein AABY09_03320 [Nanoarchaeota archaeon]